MSDKFHSWNVPLTLSYQNKRLLRQTTPCVSYVAPVSLYRVSTLITSYTITSLSPIYRNGISCFTYRTLQGIGNAVLSESQIRRRIKWSVSKYYTNWHISELTWSGREILYIFSPRSILVSYILFWSHTWELRTSIHKFFAQSQNSADTGATSNRREQDISAKADSCLRLHWTWSTTPHVVGYIYLRSVH